MPTWLNYFRCGEWSEMIVRRWRVIIMGVLITGGSLWASDHVSAQPPEDRTPKNNAPLQRLLMESEGQYASPFVSLRVHRINKMQLTVTNWGVFGGMDETMVDPATGLPAPGASFPAGYNIEHLNYGALWIGAVIGRDTLVSTAHDGVDWVTELYPPAYNQGGGIRERSTRPDSPNYDPEAISEQDYICTYADTLTDGAYVPADRWSWRAHIPIGIRVRQESFAWPYEYAEDFIIIRYWLTNLRDDSLSDVRVGFLVRPQVHHRNNVLSKWDDHLGFRRTLPSITGFNFADTANLVWFADNGGDPTAQLAFDLESPTSVAGISIIGTPTELTRSGNWWSPDECWRRTYDLSFNWWHSSNNARYDWGPQHAPPDRSWIDGMGEPLGDRLKYRMMANGEIDYDQIWANSDFGDQGWIGPPVVDEFFASNLARGYPTRALLSAGPFTIQPGDSIPIVLAVVGGEGFHNDPRNIRNLPNQHERYYEKLDFFDISQSIQWAKWVYDNPGLDTDLDGCSGYYFYDNCRDTLIWFDEWCVEWQDSLYCWYNFWSEEEFCDTLYYAGDGIPDLKGPPPPVVRVSSEPGRIVLCWDGRLSEPFYDDFSHRVDFEGYNVYAGLGHNPGSLALLASWDLINFERYRFVPTARPTPWINTGAPLTMEDLAQIYGADFDPLQYDDPIAPFVDQSGQRFYFKPHSGNRSNEYPENGQIVANRIQYLWTDSIFSESSQRWQYYGHYECTIEDLLPSQSYNLAVTAFDHGFAQGGLGPLESATQANMQLAYPTYSPDHVLEKQLPVAVYPNPYRIDAAYRNNGYEDPNRNGFVERTRRINFINLPVRATIKIFSIDGDLIKEIHHPDDRLSDSPSHTAWDMITRNTQSVVSGIYVYSVESEAGTQVGKIVIIK